MCKDASPLTTLSKHLLQRTLIFLPKFFIESHPPKVSHRHTDAHCHLFHRSLCWYPRRQSPGWRVILGACDVPAPGP